MSKTILITGSTDGIGLLTAKKLIANGHNVLLHGRNEKKLSDAAADIDGNTETYCADLSSMKGVKTLASAIQSNHETIDVLINNAGVFKIPNPVTDDGYDLRIMVNTAAPYLLTKLLLPIMSSESRVINLSSAAQTAVEMKAFKPNANLSDNAAYGQSKLALTMWSMHLAATLGNNSPSIIAINPASFLASKMVKDAYGMPGNNLSIGADILVRAALSDEFANASGRYFDNDQGKFSAPHPDALVASKNEHVTKAIEAMLIELN
ncbi:SDR family NAD(P)-dependent oxidoreductase [Kiloniella majae]|uniref:SDR family NAD(P)-dependent oxidoreductase n=1 Tax=Kiloniella majae TaxID=1938558 RepID=UPI000A279800|nr:SDR family NAD(P)-dependent oxidoreductase [Kiloniella majae]